MKDDLLISVIIPVYNVKEYLRDCLESVIGQTYKNLEIIVVDDGSTDGSSKLCDELAEQDTRIKIIHQKNNGVAVARKKGVMCSRGAFICFVDADDEIDKKMIEYMAGRIGKCDLLTTGLCFHGVQGEHIEKWDSIEKGIYSTDKEKEYLTANMLAYKNQFDYGILPYLWNKMFRAEILKPFIASMNSSLSYAEDVEVLFPYILRCKAVCVTHECLYYYRAREDSATYSENKDYMCDLFKVYQSLEKAFQNHSQEKALMHQLQLFVTERIYAITGYMGFSVNAQIIKYCFPYSELKRGSKIVLYGAGRVGMDYYRLIHRQKMLELALWVDKDWEKYNDISTPVYAPETVKNCDYDYIVIAVRKGEIANEIREELVKRGIEPDKILWRVPAIM